MDAEDTIKTILTDNNIDNYPIVAPHDANAPFVIYQEISSDLTIRTHAGNQGNRSIWQLACWSYDYSSTKTLAKTVRSLFDMNQTNFEIAMINGNFDLPAPDSNLYRRILEARVWETGV